MRVESSDCFTVVMEIDQLIYVTYDLATGENRWPQTGVFGFSFYMSASFVSPRLAIF